MSVIFKVFVLLWPFVKEMVLGDKSLLYALKNNKKKVLFIMAIFMSVGLNFILVSKLVSISKDYLDLTNKYSTSTDMNFRLTRDKHNPEPIAEKDTVKSIVNGFDPTDIKCIVPPLPPIPITPPLPMKEINALGPKDMAGLAEIEKRHIVELRRQLEFMKKTLIMYKDDVDAICAKKY